MNATPQSISQRTGHFLSASFLGAALLLIPYQVQAAGGGSPTPPPAPSSNPPACGAKTTKNSCLALSHCYWSSNKCKRKKNSEIQQNNIIYAKGRLLAKSGEFKEAIEVLKTGDQTDPHVLNYLGYSYRKSGDLKTAIGYYKAALKINPDFVLAREYLGEGYVKAGRIDLAKLELAQIAQRCGKGCKEYVELAAVIDGTDKGGW